MRSDRSNRIAAGGKTRQAARPCRPCEEESMATTVTSPRARRVGSARLDAGVADGLAARALVWRLARGAPGRPALPAAERGVRGRDPRPRAAGWTRRAGHHRAEPRQPLRRGGGAGGAAVRPAARRRRRRRRRLLLRPPVARRPRRPAVERLPIPAHGHRGGRAGRLPPVGRRRLVAAALPGGHALDDPARSDPSGPASGGWPATLGCRSCRCGSMACTPSCRRGRAGRGAVG